jgi:hypothetical protein
MKAIEKSQYLISTTLLVLLAVIVLMLMMSGCTSERIEGNHDVITQERQAQPFSEVVSQGSFSVKIIPSNSNRIEVKGESNIIPHLRTIFNGTTLTLSFNDGFNIHEHYPVEVFLYTPVINSVRLPGSGTIDCGDFTTNFVNLDISGSGNINGIFITDKIEAVISGSGNINLGGAAQTGKFNISGSGNINALNLTLQNCSAGISGSGNISATVIEILDASISGSGSIFYLGNPVIKINITGSGILVKY